MVNTATAICVLYLTSKVRSNQRVKRDDPLHNQVSSITIFDLSMKRRAFLHHQEKRTVYER